MAMFVSPSISRLTLILTATILASACSVLEEARPVQKSNGVVLQDTAGDLTSRVRDRFLSGEVMIADPVPEKETKKEQAETPKTKDPAKQSTATEITRKLSLEEAIERALRQNPERQIATAQAGQAEASIDEAKSAYYPQANLKIDAGREYNNPFSVVQGSTGNSGYSYGNNTSLNIRQMLFDGFITREAVAQRMAQARSANFNRDKITEELIKNTIEVYLQLVQFQEISATAAENYKGLQEIAKLVDLRATAGDTSVSEKNYMLARLANAEQEKINANSALKDAQSALRYLTGETSDFIAELPTLPLEEMQIGEDELLTQALRKNTDILVNQSDLAAARHEVAASKGQFYPNLSFVVDGGHAEDLGGETGVKRAASGKFELNYKIFDGGLRSATVQRQTGKVKEVEARGDRIRRELKQNVSQGYNKLNSAAKEMTVAITEVKANTELERVYREQFKFGDGDVDVTNLVEARERIFTASVKKIRLRNDVINANYTLKRLVGDLLLPFCGKKCP
jgi:adhesin transport system outer membrane protein